MSFVIVWMNEASSHLHTISSRCQSSSGVNGILGLGHFLGEKAKNLCGLQKEPLPYYLVSSWDTLSMPQIFNLPSRQVAHPKPHLRPPTSAAHGAYDMVRPLAVKMTIGRFFAGINKSGINDPWITGSIETEVDPIVINQINFFERNTIAQSKLNCIPLKRLHFRFIYRYYRSSSLYSQFNGLHLSPWKAQISGVGHFLNAANFLTLDKVCDPNQITSSLFASYELSQSAFNLWGCP